MTWYTFALSIHGFGLVLGMTSNCLWGSTAPCQDPQAAAIIEKSRQHLALIESMEMDVSYRQRDPSLNNGNLIEESARMLFSNDMWRSEGVVGISKQPYIAAFNGHRYQMIYSEAEESKTLVLSNQATFPNPAIQLPPVVQPFAFAVDKSRPYTLGQLRDPTTWENVISHARFVDSRTFDRQPCSVVEIQQEIQGENFRTLVWFASRLFEFPIKTELFDSNGRSLGELVVSRTRQFDVEGTTVVVPMEISETIPLPEGIWERTVTVDPSSIKINEPVDEDQFTIPASIVEYVRDVDSNSYIRVGSATSRRLDNVSLKKPSQTYRWTVWLAGILLVCGIVAYVCLKKRP